MLLELVYFVLGAGLVAYVLTGGADFGGGFWHLVARGPRKEAQQAAIEHAIAPIWEANHVWLIFVVVLMFTTYPRAFAVVSIAFHVPIALALVGIVLRGASFVFKAYGFDRAAAHAWGRVFAIASAVTPLFLGMVLGGMSSGAVHVANGHVTSGFFAGWTTPFALLTGGFALALFALLAAVYLTVDAPRPVVDDFRRRALAMGVVAGAFALAVFLAAGRDAPLLRARLAASAFFMPVQLVTAACAATVFGALWLRRYRVARIAAAFQVVGVVVGWGAAMDGELVLGAVSATDAGGRIETMRVVLPILVGGSALLLPALAYLFRVFKAGPGAHGD